MTAPAAMPLVSVIIPTHNRAGVVGRAIRSVLAQTYPCTEIIVIDDRSTDNTPEILATFGDSIKVVRTTGTQGPAAARNSGIARCSGELVAFLDSDDVWQPHKLAAQVAVFLRRPASLAGVYTGRRTLLADGAVLDIRPRRGENTFESLCCRDRIVPSTLVVRRAVLHEVGLFDTRLPACEDWDLLLRIARRYTFDFIDDIAVVVDATASNRMSNRSRAVFLATHMILRRFSGRRPSREVLAGYLAIQARELFQMERFELAARYALRSLWLKFDRDEKLALRTLKRILRRAVIRKLSFWTKGLALLAHTSD